MRRLLAIVLLCCASWPVLAQDYFFAVPNLTMEVFIRKDSSIKIAYEMTFDNKGRTIDVVDIGAPTKRYRLDSVTASLDGKPLRDVRRSEFVNPGFEVHLDQHSIRRGQSGTFRAEFDVTSMVYQDTTRDDYASFQITPTWFGSRYVSGLTRIDIVVHVPGGIAAEEVIWQDKEFSAKGLAGDDSHVIVGWRFENVSLTGPHRVGLSFPKRDMSGVIEMSRWQLLEEWLEGRPKLRNGLTALFFVGLAALFFRFSGGTGFSVFALLGAGLFFLFSRQPLAILALLVPLPFLIYLNERKLRQRRTRYLPAIAQVEGGGIKRGLTAQEAAIVIERPLGQVLGLVIFGLLKKNIVRQTDDDPLTVVVNEPFRLPNDGKLNALDVVAKLRTAVRKESGFYLHDGADEFYRAAGQQEKTVIHSFEQAFLAQLQLHDGTPVAELDFSVAMRLLIERVAGRLTGFDLSDTRDYYEAIVKRATKMALAIGEVDIREKGIDRDLEWILMGDRLDDVFVRGHYRYRPPWIRGGWYGSAGGGIGDAGGSVGIPETGARTSFGDVAASFAGWSENTMGQMASAIQPGSLSFGDLPDVSGLVDLSGADRITGEVLEAFFSDSGRRGGGGGGGCACAGCACACACAGGGR